MYCSNCGARASGKFCSNCGERLTPHHSAPEARGDWQDETRYEQLAHHPRVRELIARSAMQASRPKSSDQILESIDKVAQPLLGVPLSSVAAIAVPIATRLGLHTAKSRSARVCGRPGAIVVAALCSLARAGWPLNNVHQGSDGCVIEATLPSDFWSWQGQALIAIQHRSDGSLVEARTHISGQLYDWGKSDKFLDQLFADLRQPPSA